MDQLGAKSMGGRIRIIVRGTTNGKGDVSPLEIVGDGPPGQAQGTAPTVILFRAG